MRRGSNGFREIFSRRISRRRMLTGMGKVGAGIAVIGLSGCAATGQISPAKKLDRLVFATSRDLEALDPHISTSIIDAMSFFPLMYDSLTIMQRDIRPGPNLAASWENPDENTWLFKLRQGVKFHNGEDFDAQTAQFNVQRVLDPQTKSPHFRLVAAVEGVDAPDKYTLRMKTKAPDPILLSRLTDLFIIPKKYVEEKGIAIMKTSPVGSGPYQFVQWRKDEFIEAEKAAGTHFRVPNPPANVFVQRVVPQAASRVALLVTKEADIAWSVPFEDFERIKKDPELDVFVDKVSSSYGEIWMSQLSKPLQDKRVRQAINYAVNKEEIVKSLFQGSIAPIGQPATPACFGYDDKIKAYPYDPKKARDLLAAAGFPNGLEMDLYQTTSGYVKYNEYMQAIANYLSEVGIKTTIRSIPEGFSGWMGRLRKDGSGPPAGLHHASSYCPFLDLSMTYIAYWVTWDEKTGLGNYMYISNPEIDRLTKEAQSTLDQKRRKEALGKISQLVHDEAYALFLFPIPWTWGYNKKKLKALHPRDTRLHAWDVEPA
ncbi:MAG: hypothetical protein HYU86_01060 [Chloroflexi bacterium]|nr:hypothetical protein [Chloroflexota bacterium]